MKRFTDVAKCGSVTNFDEFAYSIFTTICKLFCFVFDKPVFNLLKRVQNKVIWNCWQVLLLPWTCSESKCQLGLFREIFKKLLFNTTGVCFDLNKTTVWLWHIQPLRVLISHVGSYTDGEKQMISQHRWIFFCVYI